MNKMKSMGSTGVRHPLLHPFFSFFSFLPAGGAFETFFLVSDEVIFVPQFPQKFEPGVISDPQLLQ